MRKRGIYIALGGLLIVFVSFLTAMTLVSNTGISNSEFSISEMMKGMFDEVTDKTQIDPEQTNTFSFDASSDVNTLFWGLQIMDYENDDSVSVSISNIYGDEFGTFGSDQPAFFETMKIKQPDIYSFNVKNTGHRPIHVVMMFTKNPEESKRFSGPNSPLTKTVLPIAAAGMLLIIGIISTIVGGIILVVDYKKKNSRFN